MRAMARRTKIRRIRRAIITLQEGSVGEARG
jgi:hypothetical protein